MSQEKVKDSQAEKTPSDLFRWQSELFKNWQEAWQKGLESWQKLWEQGEAKFPGFDLFTSWMDFLKKQFDQLLGGETEGLGAEVFSRILNAGAIYTQIMEFWKNALASVITFPEGKLDPEKLKELSEKWMEQYQSVMESLWGKEDETRSEIIQSAVKMLRAQSDFIWGFLTPLMKDFQELGERFPQAISGESKRALEFYALLRKSYEDSLGKILRMPTMGYFRELQERINRSLDSYVEFLTVLNHYYSLFYQTGLRAMERVLNRLEEFKDEDWSTPQGVRKFYRLWWTINEDTYYELFLSEEFINLLREVLSRGLLFRKWLEELYDKMIEPTPLPSKKDMDEIYQAIYELKKEVRWQRKALEQLTGKNQIPEPENE